MKEEFWLFQLLQIIRKQLPSLALEMCEVRLFSGENAVRQVSEGRIMQVLSALLKLWLAEEAIKEC